MQNPWVVLHLILPFLCVLSFGRCLSTRGFAWSLMAGVALYQVILFCSAMILGHLEVLFPVYYRGALVAAALGAFGFAMASMPSIFREVRQTRYRPTWVDIIIIPTVVLFLHTTWLEIKYDWTYGPNFFDSMAYHVPRAMIWSWHGNFHPWATAVWHQIGNGVGGSATMLPLVLMGRGWLGGGWTGLVCAYGSAAALFVIARSLHFSMRSSFLAALCLMACPVIGLRFSDLTTDIGAAFPVLAGVALFRTLPLKKGMFYFIALSGIGAACKQYVAFPVILASLVMFIPRWREIVFDKRVICSLFAGVIAAASACILSFLPLYEAFGTISGGPEAMGHSSFVYGREAVSRVTKVIFLNWLVEPLSLLHVLERLQYLPEKTTEMIADAIGIGTIYSKYLRNDVWYPVFSPFNTRSGIIPLLLLPWLIMSVKRGYRWYVTGLFIALFLTQVSIFNVNYWSARFMILNLAGFALLWASRAEKNPFLVSLIILAGMYSSYRYIEPMRRELYGYHPNYEHMRETVGVVTPGEPIWLLSTPLTNDAYWGGRLGQYRFEYVVCPPDRDWVRLFTGLKPGARWFILPGNGDIFKPGPSYESLLGPVCPNEKVSDIKKYLTEAGWRYKQQLPALYELWTSSPDVSESPQ